MSMRAFLVVIILLLIIGAGGAYVFLNVLGGNGNGATDLLPGAGNQPESGSAADSGNAAGQEPGLPTPTATPTVRYSAVVVARVDLPVGQILTPDLLLVEQRPDSNIAVQAGVTFASIDEVAGQMVRTQVPRGQEILRPMLALNPADLSSLGSDLALYVDQGRVAVAFPINSLSGAAFAMRPGDLIDVFMSVNLVSLDEEFQTILPNTVERVDPTGLEEGTAFLFPPETEGRLELIPLINVVANITPGTGEVQIPRRLTQLTIQQAEVLWVGTWFNPNTQTQEFEADAVEDVPVATPNADGAVPPQPTPTKERPEDRPDVIILSLTAQDALALKWSLETGIDIDLVLRAQGDVSVFFTTSVSLPQMVEQGGLIVPEPSDQGLQPPVNVIPTPGVPSSPPGP